MPNGVTASFPRFGPMPETPPRGKVEGWSRKSTGRLRRWFFTVDGDRLDGQGVAVTLTVRDLPPSAADWTRTRERFLHRMRRVGLVRGQWLTEWQRRGVPHLHGCLFLPKDAQGLQELVTGHWLASAAEYGPTASAQHITPLWGLSGWLQYQAKHSSRGMRHYQRANVPESWRTGTGRLWGVVGDWPTREELAEISGADFHRFRRLLRSWLVAEARKTNDPRRAAYLRGLLRDPEPTRSRVRAVGEFCPERVSRELLAAATYGELIEFVSPALSAEQATTARTEAPQRA
jgi:hypothetical protein